MCAYEVWFHNISPMIKSQSKYSWEKCKVYFIFSLSFFFV